MIRRPFNSNFSIAVFFSSILLGEIITVESLAAEQLDLFPSKICLGGFKLLAPPVVDGRTVTHILLGNFSNRRLVSGMHSWQGVEKFKDFLRREYGLKDASVDRAVRITEISDSKPAKVIIDRQYLTKPSIPKSMFPRSWSGPQIIKAIEMVAKEPDTSFLLPSGDRQLSGIYSGCRIEMKVSPEGKIKTAYPSSNQEL